MQVEIIRRVTAVHQEHFLVTMSDGVDVDNLTDDELEEITDSHRPYHAEAIWGENPSFEVAAL